MRTDLGQTDGPTDRPKVQHYIPSASRGINTKRRRTVYYLNNLRVRESSRNYPFICCYLLDFVKSGKQFHRQPWNTIPTVKIRFLGTYTRLIVNHKKRLGVYDKLCDFYYKPSDPERRIYTKRANTRRNFAEFSPELLLHIPSTSRARAHREVAESSLREISLAKYCKSSHK